MKFTGYIILIILLLIGMIVLSLIHNDIVQTIEYMEGYD